MYSEKGNFTIWIGKDYIVKKNWFMNSLNRKAIYFQATYSKQINYLSGFLNINVACNPQKPVSYNG